MRVLNHTQYRTADLAAFFRAGLKAQVGAEWKSYVIEVYPYGKRRISRARYNQPRIWMVLPEEWQGPDGLWQSAVRGWALPRKWKSLPRRANIVRLAWVFVHEVGHTLGLHHKDMQTIGGMEIPPWCLGLEIRSKEAPVRTSGDRATSRAAHVQAMVERWGRRLVVARRTLAKWRRKARYYERRAAAAPKENDACQR